MLRTLFSTATVLAFALNLGGCGKTDPVSEYGLKAVPKEGDRQNPEQTKADSPFQFDVSEKDAIRFLQGEEKTAQLHVRIVDPNVTGYELSIQEIPPGATLTQVDPTTWNFKWKPTNVIAEDSQHALFYLSVEIWVTEATDKRYKWISKKPATIPLYVDREGKAPRSVNEKQESKTVKAGEKTSLTLDIHDSSGASEAPVGHIFSSTAKQTGSISQIDGKPFVTLMADSPEKLPNGDWRYTYSFDTSDEETLIKSFVRTVDTTADSNEACFSMKYAPPALPKFESAEYSYCVTIQHRPSTPTMKSTPTTVTVGRTNTVAFDIQVPSKRGRLSLNQAGADSALSTLPGNPQLKCDPKSATGVIKLSCRMTWKMDCATAFEEQYAVALQATHEVAGEKSTSDLSQTLKVVKTATSCPAPKPTKPVTPVKTPAQGATK